MRPSSLAYVLFGVLIFWATYRILNQSPVPNIPTDQFDASEQHPFEQKSDPLPIYKDEARLRAGDVAPANVNPDELAIAKDKAQLEDRNERPTNQSSDLKDAKQNLSYLAYYAYSEVPPETKPADTVLKLLEDIPRGTPIEEIRRVADAFGLDRNFMKAVAKIESDFNPKQRTGSYIGLFQLSNAEFQQYGSGDILDPRDNAVAAVYKFLTEDILFEITTHKKPTLNDIYLIHQQGWQGAAEHVSHSDRLAWKSMCATDEGREKGEKWCKRAIWGNTVPAIKHIWKTVNNLTSSAFVAMWQQRVSQFYSRYSETTAK
jgi:Transglycosylase SLT domain